MQGGLIVNVFSQFIQEKAEEENKPYDVVLNKFWKNKKMQKEWKNYKDNITKDVFVPEQRYTAPQTISYPIHPYTSSMDFKPDEEVPTPETEERRERNWENSFKGRVLTALEGVEEELGNVLDPPSPAKKPKSKKLKRKFIIEVDEEPQPEPVEEDEFPYGRPTDFDAPLRQWFQTPKRQLEELKRVDDELLSLLNKYIQVGNTPDNMTMEMRLMFETQNNSTYRYLKDKKKELIGLLLETQPAVETISTLGTPIVMTRDGAIKKRKIEGLGINWEYMFPLRQNYPPKVRTLLQQKGNEQIERVIIYRAPLSRSTNILLQVFTSIAMKGAFQQRLQDLNYDKLYHLGMWVETKQGSRIFINKNEVIEIELSPKLSPEAELKQVALERTPQNITLNELLERTKQRMGKRFFVYNAATNNCQDFIVNILDANNIGDQSDREFVKQNVEYLFQNASRTISFASLLTSLAALRNKMIEGEGLYKVQSVLFSKDKWDNPDKAGEWLESHSYLNKGLDDKPETYRFRQLNPAYIRKKGYKRFITKPLGDSGVSLILAYK